MEYVIKATSLQVSMLTVEMYLFADGLCLFKQPLIVQNTIEVTACCCTGESSVLFVSGSARKNLTCVGVSC